MRGLKLCSVCKEPGHNRLSCPKNGGAARQHVRSASRREECAHRIFMSLTPHELVEARVEFIKIVDNIDRRLRELDGRSKIAHLQVIRE